MSDRCEWCGARGGVGHTFEAEWRRHHHTGPAEAQTWHVCNLQCEALLREHLRQTVERGFPSVRAYILWLLRFHALTVGLPVAAVWAVAEAAGWPTDRALRVGLALVFAANGAGYFLWLRSGPIWANQPKPSRACVLGFSIRTGERLVRVAAIVLPVVLFLAAVAILVLPDLEAR